VLAEEGACATAGFLSGRRLAGSEPTAYCPAANSLGYRHMGPRANIYDQLGVPYSRLTVHGKREKPIHRLYRHSRHGIAAQPRSMGPVGGRKP